MKACVSQGISKLSHGQKHVKKQHVIFLKSPVKCCLNHADSFQRRKRKEGCCRQSKPGAGGDLSGACGSSVTHQEITQMCLLCLGFPI